MRRVTIKTLAKELGVSVCTINKALTGKPRVSAETRERVIEAAKRLGYRPNRLARALVRPPITIGAVYPDAWPSHYGLLMEGVRLGLEELRDHHVAGEFTVVPGFTNSSGFVRTVGELADRRVGGLILTLGMYAQKDLDEAWRIISERRVPFVLLGADLPGAPRLCSVWHDTVRSGRMAGELLAGLVGKGPVALIVGGREGLDHANKVAAFRQEAERASLAVAGIYETLDDPNAAYPAAERLFAEHPEVAGLYIASENAGGVCRYLVDRGLAGKVKVIATGIPEDVVAMIRQGVVQFTLFQNPQRQGRIAVRTLYRYIETGERPAPEILVPPAVVMRSTLDLWASGEPEPGMTGPRARDSGFRERD